MSHEGYGVIVLNPNENYIEVEKQKTKQSSSDGTDEPSEKRERRDKVSKETKKRRDFYEKYRNPQKEKEMVQLFIRDEFLKSMPVQKQTPAGQRTRFKAFVAIGDYNGHVGLGVKCSKEVATTIREAVILAKLSIVPVWRDSWGNKIGKPHTVPCKVTGHCGSVLVRLIPAPRGTGIVSAPVSKKILMMAGIDDCYTSARGCTATLGNFAKATFGAISKTYSYLTPNLWKETVFTNSPYQESTDHLVKTHTRVSVQRTQAPTT
ncbi:hypothetical protein STEG23_016011 [Scotinomys teguina]